MNLSTTIDAETGEHTITAIGNGETYTVTSDRALESWHWSAAGQTGTVPCWPAPVKAHWAAQDAITRARRSA